MKNKVAVYSIADPANMKFYEMLKNSWNKFHPDIPINLIEGENLSNRLKQDPMFFYRAKPILALEAFKQGYDTVVVIDADSIVTGDLSHTWEGEFDVAVVQNSNPHEMKTYPVAVWDISPMAYVNCGYVVMKSKTFAEHWNALCFSPHFDNYQFKEQDLLNIMVFYCGYKVNYLDSNDKWHGLASKGYWQNIELRQRTQDGLGSLPNPESRENPYLILPQDPEWPQSGDKEICIIHWAGGNEPGKMNYRTKFQEDVVKHLDWLVSSEKVN